MIIKIYIHTPRGDKLLWCRINLRAVRCSDAAPSPSQFPYCSPNGCFLLLLVWSNGHFMPYRLRWTRRKPQRPPLQRKVLNGSKCRGRVPTICTQDACPDAAGSVGSGMENPFPAFPPIEGKAAMFREEVRTVSGVCKLCFPARKKGWRER